MALQFNRAEVLLADMGDANMPDDLFLEYSEPRSVSIVFACNCSMCSCIALALTLLMNWLLQSSSFLKLLQRSIVKQYIYWCAVVLRITCTYSLVRLHACVFKALTISTQ
jgi:hypothetical protein